MLALGLGAVVAAPAAASQTASASAAPQADLSNAGKTHSSPAPQRGVPEGFEDLDAPQSAVVDVVFGGTRVGKALITHHGSTLAFQSPSEIMALLPALTEPATVLAELSRTDLAVNAHLLCRAGADQTTCERLAPRTVGVILDRDRFRVLIFIAPALLALRSNVPSTYLPAPAEAASLIHSISTSISGQGGQHVVANFDNELVAASGSGRIRAEFGYSTGLGMRLDTLRAELDRPGWRYSAGALWSRSGSFIGRRKLLGIEAVTQTDTRLDKDNLKGSPLAVFLEQRSRVDILREGRILASRIYDAGNQLLDTSALPEGAYEVTISIQSINGTAREERQFFSKNTYLPAPGQVMLHSAAGLLVSERSSGLPQPTGTPFLQAGIARRITPKLVFELNAQTTDKAAVLELASTLESAQMQLRTAVLVSSRGERAALMQLSSAGASPLNFHVDLRRVVAARGAGAGTQPLPKSANQVAPEQVRFALPTQSPLLQAASRSFTQITGAASYSLAGAQVQANGYYRREQGRPADYSFGPALRVNLLERTAWQLTFNADAAVTSRGKSGYVGLNFQLLRSQASFTARTGARASPAAGQAPAMAASGALMGAFSRSGGAGTLDVAGGYEREAGHDIVNLSAQLRAEKGNLAGQISKGFSGPGSALHYSFGVQTTLAWRGDNAALTGPRRGEGAVLLKVESDQPAARFEVLLNDTPSAEFTAGQQLALTLPAYRTYNVRIRPVGQALLHIAQTARSISLFPGSVVSLDWQAKRQLPVFGQLVFADGRPVRFATIRTASSAAMTDEAGYFQMETSTGAQLEVNLPGTGQCIANMPVISLETRFQKLGRIECKLPVSHRTDLFSPRTPSHR